MVPSFARSSAFNWVTADAWVKPSLRRIKEPVTIISSTASGSCWAKLLWVKGRSVRQTDVHNSLRLKGVQAIIVYSLLLFEVLNYSIRGCFNSFLNRSNFNPKALQLSCMFHASTTFQTCRLMRYFKDLGDFVYGGRSLGAPCGTSLRRREKLLPAIYEDVLLTAMDGGNADFAGA